MILAIFTSYNICNATNTTTQSLRGTSRGRSNTSLGSDTNGTWDAIQSCNGASVSWRSAHQYSGTQTKSASIYITTIVNETVITPNATTFTLCDSYPRANVTPSTSINTYTATSSEYIFKYVPAVCRTGCPSCSINSEGCSQLWSSWSSYLSMTTDMVPYITKLYQSPACPSPTPTTTSSYKCYRSELPPCYFTAGSVRLVYFPPEVKGDRLCGNYSTVTSATNAIAPIIAETLGTTFTSGTAYISFESLAAYDLCGMATGTSMTSFFVPLPSGDVSSMCGTRGDVFEFGPTSTRLNYADLQEPIAKDVYKCMPQCLWGVTAGVVPMWQAQCPMIVSNYKPVLAYPRQVTALQQEWNSCWFNPNIYFRLQQQQEYYLFDPPISLTQVTTVGMPTLPPQTAHSTSAQPPATTAGHSPTSRSHSSGGLLTATVTSHYPFDSEPVASKSDQESSYRTPSVAHSRSRALSGQDTFTVTADSSSRVTLGVSRLGSTYIVDGSTIGAGSAATVGGQIISIVDGGGSMVVGASRTITIADGRQTSITDSVPILLTGLHSGSAIVVAGQTLMPGQVATANGGVLSVASDGSALVFGTRTIPLPALGGHTSEIAISRHGIEYVVGRSTLAPGQIQTIQGEAVSVLPNGNGLVVGSSTIFLPRGAATTMIDPEPTQHILEVSRSGAAYIVDGTTLKPGGAIPVDGNVVAELSDGSGLVTGTSTLLLEDRSATSMSPSRTSLPIARTSPTNTSQPSGMQTSGRTNTAWKPFERTLAIQGLVVAIVFTCANRLVLRLDIGENQCFDFKLI